MIGPLALPLTLILMFAGDPPASPPAAGEDILRGPEVPAEALKPDRTKKPQAKEQVPQRASRPALEQKVFFDALAKLKLDDAKRAKADAMRDSFAKSVDEWTRESEVKRKELFDKRKQTPTGKAPSEEFRKAVEEIEAKRPKLAELKANLSKELSPDEMKQLKVLYDEGLKRAYDELTVRTEEARKKIEAERKRKAQESGAQKDKPEEGRSSEDKSDSPADGMEQQAPSKPDTPSKPG